MHQPSGVGERRYVSALTLLAFISVPAYSQVGVVPDTLDWHRYFPLAIGNAWEYGSIEGPPLTRLVITRDTIASDRQYLVLEETHPGYGEDGMPLYLRYDTSGTVVALGDVNTDSTTYPRAVTNGEILDCPFGHSCSPLRAAFGDTLFFDSALSQYSVVTGGYDRSVLGETVAALKCFDLGLWYNHCYATDVGWTGGGNLLSYYLTYARVGGVEYGSSRVSAVDPPPTAADSELVAFPNPTSGAVHIQFSLGSQARPRVVVFDVLGRLVYTANGRLEVGKGQIDIDVADWAPGHYFVRLIGANRTGLSGQILVRR